MDPDLYGLLKDEPELWGRYTLKKCYSGDNGDRADPFCPSVSRFLSQKGAKFEYPEVPLPDVQLSGDPGAFRAAGFRYDTTIGYSDGVGFRNGMCHPYDLTADKEMGTLEIPMIIMDCVLLDHHRSFREAWDITKRPVDETERYNGVLTMLWHNDAFSLAYKRDW
jgi:hypothetical protein